jgi:hypothetical protein
MVPFTAPASCRASGGTAGVLPFNTVEARAHLPSAPLDVSRIVRIPIAPLINSNSIPLDDAFLDQFLMIGVKAVRFGGHVERFR